MESTTQTIKPDALKEAQDASGGVTPADVERYVALSDKVQKALERLAPIQSEMGDLEARFKAHAKGFPPEDRVVIEGDAHNVEFSIVPEKMTLVDKKRAAERLEEIKPGLFAELCSIGIGQLKKYLDGVTFEAVTETERSGTRRMSVKVRDGS